MRIEVFIISLFFLMLFGCTPAIKKNYSGYIYYDNEPLNKIKVIESSAVNYTFTDEKGYFNLNRSNKTFVNDLVFEKDGEIDTIKLARGSGAGSRINFLFLTTKIDTINLKRERLLKKQSDSF